MTDAPFLSAIMDQPVSDGPRLVFADHLDEQGRSAAALEQRLAVANKPVLAAPDDDAPRLAYANICDQYGDPRGEFIRVQCRLAKPPWTSQDLIREHDLLLKPTGGTSYQWDKWRPLPSDTEGWQNLNQYENNGTRRSGIVFRRGFVEEISCTLAEFMGGPCQRCEGRGFLDQIGAEDASVDPLWVRGLCRACDGTGHTPGIAPALFAAAPITKVTLTDRVPSQWELSNAAGIRPVWHWLFPVGGVIDEPERLPEVLMAYMPDVKGLGRRIEFDSRELAQATLSDACVAYGRSVATGMTHEVGCERCESKGGLSIIARGLVRGIQCPACRGIGKVRRPGLPPLVMKEEVHV